MKKAAGLFLLAFMVANCAFSQDAAPSAGRLSMWNRGLFNLYESGGTTSVGPNWIGYTIPQGAYNSLSFDWAGKNVSWTMTGEWEGDWVDYHVTLRDFSGTFNLFNGLMRLTAGKVWSGDDYRFRNFDTLGFATRVAYGKTGLLLRFFPVKGLNIGAFLPMPVASQSAAITYGRMNFGAEWTAGKTAIVRASYRQEPDAKGNREIAIGLGLTSIKDFGLAVGYTNRDVTQENDFFLDASYRWPRLELHGYGDIDLIGADIFYGFKINAEFTFPKAPFTIGASAAYGNGDLWWINGLDLNPYVRYNFGQSSIQTGFDLLYTTSLSYKAQLAYTVGF
jgi:hypothetical protein